MRIRRDVVSVVADTHIGSTTGLVCPEARLDNGETLPMSKTQAWMYDRWSEFWECVYRIKLGGDGKRWFIHLGDATDRPGQHESTEFWTMDTAAIRDAAVSLLKPHVDDHDYAFMVRGTAVHVGPEASDEEDLARELGCIGDSQTGTSTWWDLPISIQGVFMHFAHYTACGSRPWTAANSANLNAADVVMSYARYGETPPQLAVRAHVHRYTDSYYNFPTRLITCPAWQLKSSYARRKYPVQRSDIGGLIVVIEDGEIVDVHVKRFYAERRQPWVEPDRKVHCM